jgi:hypothetical protein
MIASNLIHGLTFDVAFDGSAESGESLAEWLREALLPVIDEALEQHDRKGHVCRIERLEIDLGDVTREDADGELSRRLHAQLSAALEWSEAAVTESTVVAARQQDLGGQLLSFLRSGRLPWSVAADRHTAHEQLLQRLLAAPQAKTVLQAAVQEQQMLTRLVRQFPPGMLLEVAELLHPDFRPAVPADATEAFWCALLRGDGRGDTPGIQITAARLTQSASSFGSGTSSSASSDLSDGASGLFSGVEKSKSATTGLQSDARTSLGSARMKIALVRRALQEGDAEALIRLWPAITTSLRTEFSWIWADLPAEMQRRNFTILAAQLSKPDLIQLALLMKSSAPSARDAIEKDLLHVPAVSSELATTETSVGIEAIASTGRKPALQEEDENDLLHAWPATANSRPAESALAENQLSAEDRHGDLRSAEASAANGRTPPDGRRMQIALLKKALQKSNVEGLIHLWPTIITSLGTEFIAIWTSLPRVVRHRNFAILSAQLSKPDLIQLMQLTTSSAPSSRDASNRDLAEVPAVASESAATGTTADFESIAAANLEPALREEDDLLHAWPATANVRQEKSALAQNQLSVEDRHGDLRSAEASAANERTPLDGRRMQIALLRQALQEGDAEGLIHLRPAIITSLRTEFLSIWGSLPNDVQRRNFAILSAQLSKPDLVQLAQLMESSAPSPREEVDKDLAQVPAASGESTTTETIADIETIARTDGKPALQAGDEDEPRQTLLATANSHSTELALAGSQLPAESRHGDLRSAEAAKANGRTQPDAKKMQTALLNQALQESDVEGLIHLWPTIITSLRTEFIAMWTSLPRAVRHRNFAILSAQLGKPDLIQLMQLTTSSAPSSRDASNRDLAQVPAVASESAATETTADFESATDLESDLQEEDKHQLLPKWPAIANSPSAEFALAGSRLRAEESHGKLPAAETSVANGHASPEAKRMKVTLLTQALQDSEAEELINLWPTISTSLRTEFASIWANLPGEVQRHNFATLAARLSKPDLLQLVQLVHSSVPLSRNAGDAALARVADAVSEAAATETSERIEDTRLERALRDADPAELASLWPTIATSLRTEFALAWSRLPAEQQCRISLTLADQLTHEQMDELTALITPASPPPSATSIYTQEAAEEVDASSVIANVPKSRVYRVIDGDAPPVSIGMTAAELEHALREGDAEELIPIWPVIATSLRKEFASVWNRLPAATQRRHFPVLADRLREFDVTELALPVQSATPTLQPTSGSSASQIDPALASFRAWQAHKLDLPDLPMSLAALKQWLNWWLLHDTRLVNQDCSLMLEAIEHHSAQAPDPVQFIKLVLTTLRAGQALDLEELALQTNRPAAAADDKPSAMDAITTLKSHQAIRNFIAQQRATDNRLGGLNSAQLHQLVRSWIGDTSSLFLTAIEEHALQASDLHSYFRAILQSLLDDQPVDLESLCPPRVLHRIASPGGAIEPVKLPAEPSPLPLLMQKSLPQRLADALLQADLTPLQIIWPEITRFHADVLSAAAKRYLRRPQERANLVARVAPDLLIRMLTAIGPEIGQQTAPLLQYADQCNAVLPSPLTPDEFRQRILNFALEQAVEGGQGDWLDGVMRALATTQMSTTQSRDVAYAWHAILPRSGALEHALFGKRRQAAIDDEDNTSPALRALLAGDTGQTAAGAIEAPLALLLMREKPLDGVEQLAVEWLLQRLFAAEQSRLSGVLDSALSQPAAIARLTDIAAGPVLAQLLVLLQPQLAAQLPAALQAIGTELAIANVPAMQSAAVWRAVYQCAFVAADPVTPTEFIRNFVHGASGRNDIALPAPSLATRAETREKLLQSLVAPQEESMPEAADDVAIHIGDSNIRNAGMVIFATYMQRLFAMFELTHEGRFVSDEAAQRAVHLLQYATTGETSTPEYQLVLNKLFCGIHGGLPIMRGIDITQKEKDTIEQMLNGVIAHWQALGKTSISGLRQTFLQREGQLYFEEDAWHLKIPQATFDMLLDRLPWSFAMIKFPWMEHPLHVTWR